MATVQRTKCDVYETFKDVLPAAVVLKYGKEDDPTVIEMAADMSPRAVRRARHLIFKAFNKPNWKPEEPKDTKK